MKIPEFKTPKLLLRLIAVAQDLTNNDQRGAKNLLDKIIGLRISDPHESNEMFSRNYPTTPAELISFGDPGVDGTHVGYVVHAPELKADDYPVGCYCPMDGDGLCFGGVNTRDFIEMRFARVIQCWARSSTCTADECREYLPKAPMMERSDMAKRIRESADASRKEHEKHIRWICEQLNLTLDPERKATFWADNQKDMPPPVIPRGWRWLPTWDLAGVLAHERYFAPIRHEEPDIADCVRGAKRHLKNGHPATALYYIKSNSLHLPNESKDYYMEAAALGAQAYEALNRPLLAAAMKHQMTLVDRIK